MGQCLIENLRSWMNEKGPLICLAEYPEASNNWGSLEVQYFADHKKEWLISDPLLPWKASLERLCWELEDPGMVEEWGVFEIRKDMMLRLPVEVMVSFACAVARRTLEQEREEGREPDSRSWKAVEVAEAFIRGEASKEDLEAARAAAKAAVWASADSADVARAATWSAWLAWAAARAAWSATAESAAGWSAWSVEQGRKEQLSLLIRIIREWSKETQYDPHDKRLV